MKPIMFKDYPILKHNTDSVWTVEADIFKVFEQLDKVVFCHSANCFHIMGGGIARIVKEKYPRAYEVDCMTERGSKLKLGNYSTAKISENKFIINMYGQYDTGFNFSDRATSYDAIYDALKSTITIVENLDISCILIPHGLGSGLGGAKWEIIEKMIEVLAQKCTIVICKLPQ